MEIVELILKILPILALFGALYRYIYSEVEKRKERQLSQLMDIRNQIQNDPDIAHIMFLCENNHLTHDFYKSETNESNNKLYKEVVKTLGLFDSICYSFLNNQLGKSVFLYFLGEMQEIILNSTIRDYLDLLLIKNVKGITNEQVEEELLFNSVYPYGFFQVSMRLSSIEIAALTSHQLKRRIKLEKKLVNQEIYRKFFLKKV